MLGGQDADLSYAVNVLGYCLSGSPSHQWDYPHSLENLITKKPSYTKGFRAHGGIAQLGERLTGSQEVSGSIPLISTNFANRKVKNLAVCCI